MAAMKRKAEARENIRYKLERLGEVCEGAKDVRVIIYANPDPDALASALALKHMLETKERAVTIGYTGAIGRPENASMIRRLEIPAFPVSEEEATRADIIAIVDCQPQFFKDFSLPRCDIVIDHHPLLDARILAEFVDIRPNYLSTSSIMTEYLRASGVRLTRNLASALFYGIKTDARHFMGDMSQGDMEAVRWLRKKADRDIVKQIEFSQFSWEGLDYFSIALVRRRFSHGVMFSHLGPVPFFDVCVQVADFLIRVENVSWALVTGVVGDSLLVVFRNDGIKKDAGYVARSTFGGIGSAGGHESMGRAQVKEDALPEGLLLTDNRGIERFVLGSLAEVDRVFLPLLRSLR
ncbi:MAG TPA: DHH family phosphoesterase [Thermodesulfovibrionales bacterium]|nr:DHH family phosphoesterase [Thermodesulfovibrionales bacterium]